MRILQARIDGDRLASLGGASDGSGGGGEDAEVAALRVELDTVARSVGWGGKGGGGLNVGAGRCCVWRASRV